MPIFTARVDAEDIIEEMIENPEFQVRLTATILTKMNGGMMLDDFLDSLEGYDVNKLMAMRNAARLIKERADALLSAN
jgi:hypothetical protein